MMGHEHSWFIQRVGHATPLRYRWYHKRFPRTFLRLGDSLWCPCGFMLRWVWCGGNPDERAT
jgi:hypothetical protein